MNESNLLERINKGLDEIRPFLQRDGGDVSFIKVHEFDLKLLTYLNLPDWALSLIGFGQSSS